MIDYTFFYKKQLDLAKDWTEQWDVFVSAFSLADRSAAVYSKVNAKKKCWVIFPEYEYAIKELPREERFEDSLTDESKFVTKLWDNLPEIDQSTRLCIDVTAFIRPYLMFLLRLMVEKGLKKFDAIYAEPIKYSKGELTQFSGDAVKEVRQVAGFEGNHDPDTSNDLLIIGSGYEDQLITHVAEDKAKAKKLQLIGFPSLRADMFQENILRVKLAEESVAGSVDDERHAIFAPANDPFVAASELSRIVRQQKQISNLYLCPLSSKPHVLGFTLYYLYEWRDKAASMIFPFEESYSKNTSKGVSRVWKYHVELPLK